MVMQWNGAPAPQWAAPQYQQQWQQPAAVAPTLWQQATAPAPAPAPAWAGGQAGPSMASMGVAEAPPPAPASVMSPGGGWMGLPAPTATPAAPLGPGDYGATGTSPWVNPQTPLATNAQLAQPRSADGGGAFPVYNPATGTDRYDTASPTPETPEGRIYRWQQDNMRLYGMNADQAKWAAFARLKRDYERTNTDWHRSGFDLSGVQSLATEAPNAQTNYAPGGGTAPPTTGGTAPPAGNPQAGGGGPTPRNFGQLQTTDMAGLLQAAANDPDRAAQILRLAQGQQGRPLGRMADFRDSLYGRAFQTALATAGLDGFSDLQGTANDFLGKGVQANNLIGYSGDLSRRLGAQSFEGVDSATMEKQLRAALALQGLNMGSLGGAVQQGRLDDLTYEDWARNLADSSNDTRNFADLLRDSKFRRSIVDYGR